MCRSKRRIFSQWTKSDAQRRTGNTDHVSVRQLEDIHFLTPLDDQPIVIINRAQDPSVSKQNNYSVDQQKQENIFNNIPGVAQQPRYSPLYSTAAKRYLAKITLSPDEIDSLRAFLPVIDNFYHFQLYVKNKQRAREQQNQVNYGYDQNKREVTVAPKIAENPSMETMVEQKSSSH